MNSWTVHVKNFGKIEEASVEVAPLTLFVGDNNSGKSYMMTLIYGLLTMDFCWITLKLMRIVMHINVAVKLLEK